jgi:hypothetical protein
MSNEKKDQDVKSIEASCTRLVTESSFIHA